MNSFGNGISAKGCSAFFSNKTSVHEVAALEYIEKLTPLGTMVAPNGNTSPTVFYSLELMRWVKVNSGIEFGHSVQNELIAFSRVLVISKKLMKPVIDITSLISSDTPTSITFPFFDLI